MDPWTSKDALFVIVSVLLSEKSSESAKSDVYFYELMKIFLSIRLFITKILYDILYDIIWIFSRPCELSIPVCGEKIAVETDCNI